MISISKIHLKNFRKFENFEIEFNDKLNILIGDNESGKSTIIEALDLVLSGNLNKIQSIGFEKLFNVEAVRKFLRNGKKYEELPRLFVDVQLNLHGGLNPDVNGVNHEGLSSVQLDGLLLEIAPDHNYSSEISEILLTQDDNFPFEYYRAELKTFQGKSFNQYKKYVTHLLIDSSEINSEYASSEYIKTVFNSNCSSITERFKYLNEFRQHKRAFNTQLKEINDRVSDYNFELRADNKSSFERSITLASDGVTIDNHGKGKQSIIKTEFALNRRSAADLDIILLEEPENHLSHVNTRSLINKISTSHNRQIFITTHSSLITTRLGLINALVLSGAISGQSINLKMLSDDTSKFFLKAPNHKILEFILGTKIILVEGDAEYILMSELYQKVTGNSLETDGIYVIEVGGKCFKRYMELASLVKTLKVAVITDNDKNYQQNCKDNYDGYEKDNIRIFADTNPERYTFEACIYADNKTVCDELFTTERRKLPILEYMLLNKTEAAFELVYKGKASSLVVPGYISEAITWLNS